MLTVLILVIFVIVALVLVLLAIVVVAIRQEPRETEMRTVAPNLIALVVRRLLGVYLRRPVKGHPELPGDGHGNGPLVAIRSAR
jgi:hypothetical protein